MDIKCLVMTSVIALVSASAVQASDVIVSRKSVAAAPVIVAPTFSWTGFYLGGQIGSFSGNTKVDVLSGGDKSAFDKESFPKLSGFIGGLYAGSNVDLNNGLILGVDTDIVWADEDNSKKVTVIAGDNVDSDTRLQKGFLVSRVGKEVAANIALRESLSLKEKWSGATRVRIGFAADRFLPYVAGGVAYTQLRSVHTVSEKDMGDTAVSTLSDDTKWLLGYTLGAGVDFAIVDNVILRAEYRYSDFGKKNFRGTTDNDQDYKDTYGISYKTNDFRVGIAYKF
ncbi:outer membrane protein [Bartonella sp. CB175]|uniref:outer membrane protein n=1 Tax=Bartonella sp. CB175 TaxID=3112256 RepID=UPI00300E4F68